MFIVHVVRVVKVRERKAKGRLSWACRFWYCSSMIKKWIIRLEHWIRKILIKCSVLGMQSPSSSTCLDLKTILEDVCLLTLYLFPFLLCPYCLQYSKYSIHYSHYAPVWLSQIFCWDVKWFSSPRIFSVFSPQPWSSHQVLSVSSRLWSLTEVNYCGFSDIITLQSP